MRELDLWRVASVADPDFGPGTFWWFSRKAALTFLSAWVHNESWEKVYPGAETEPLGSRDLFHAIVSVPSDRVEDFTSLPVLILSSSVDLLARADDFRSSGFEWVVFYEGEFHGTISPQALYLGSEPVKAVKVVETELS